MRKVQQIRILELLETLKEAHSELRRQSAPEVVINLLSDCQNFALRIGQYIEEIEGEGTQTVALLEEYCELVYHASTDIGTMNYVKELQGQVYKIENSVRSELRPNRIEVAFFPYQFSMFDSFESVYLAAKDDPCCDTYVIPIPWFEKLSDGSFGEMHYDGGQYPDRIPITDWRKYDVEERRPDIIFVHNGYDEGNYVTSVHPDYYCKRLQNFTDLLCYLPYFVCVDGLTEHFVTIAGCAYSHKTFVQSEKIRDTYIRVFETALGGRFGKAKDKFIALGSPKYDAVISSNPEDFELPESWLKMITGSGSGRKKVLFYNTSIGGILEGGIQYLEKLRYVLDLFEERDDVVLWWRPHPLNTATYQAMCPQLADEYKQILEEYRQRGSGIYDDTPDLHRAIAWSDAYYGDWSSLVAMYQITGKPVMIQNVNIDKEYPVHAFFNFFFDDRDYLWFAERNVNAFVKMCKATWDAQFVGSFPVSNGSFSFSRIPLYQKPAGNSEYICFPSFNADEIVKYSIADDEFVGIPYKKPENSNDHSRDFFSSFIYGESAYFTPYTYPAIVQLNTRTNEISYHTEWLKPLKKLIGSIQDAYFLLPISVGDTIMAAACGANAVVEFNMETHQSVVHKVGEKGYRYNGICFDGENYWLSPRHNTPLVKWNPKTGETKEFKELYLDEGDIKFAFLPIVYCGGYVWMLPSMAKHAIKIEVRTDTISIAEEFELDYQEGANTQNGKYLFAQVCRNSIFAYSEKKEVLIEYNCETKQRKEEMVPYSPEIIEALEPLIAKAFFIDPNAMQTVYDCCYYENNLVRLGDFVNHLVQFGNSDKVAPIMDRRAEIVRSMNVRADGTSGSAIYEYAKLTIGIDQTNQ